MAVEHATRGTLPPQRVNTDYNADKVNAILPAVPAYCIACHDLRRVRQPTSQWGEIADSRKPSLEGLLQSC
jgi:hypothetical protein